MEEFTSPAAAEALHGLIQFPSSLPKPIDAATHGGGFFYEPTSVLDHNLAVAGDDFSSFAWQDPMFSYDDWGPVASWLLSDARMEEDDGFHPAAAAEPPPPPPPPDPESVGGAHLELLLRAADATESGDYGTAHLILARLNQCLQATPPPGTPPLHRAAFYFREALQLALLRANAFEAPPSPAELVRRIAAHKAFSDLSPVPQFISFTANQALLEALPASAAAIHVVDFDLGLGGQWSSFLHELAARRAPPPRVRLTAVVSDGATSAAEAGLAADNLRDFAAGLGLRLSVDLIYLGALALGAVRLSAAETVGILLSPAVLSGPPESAAAVLRFVRRASPRVVVFADTDCGRTLARRGFACGLEHYAAVLESLAPAAAAAGMEEESLCGVERAVILPRVVDAVAAWAGSSRPEPWPEYFAGAGWSPAAMSEFAESQAEWLLRRTPAEGFHLDRKGGSIVLSWKGKELAATSAWKC